ncbi:urease accessory protein UreF [Verminephrobacter aporrectodeae]|uniref:urease accessory protein UreF n=1 Tax=Verminephrobacter aporrectodeae TaxID=1110389 RepID=UPI0022432F8D|nr:urease accessory UreF family protein [Verminephrobacter aporrectodeae]
MSTRTHDRSQAPARPRRHRARPGALPAASLLQLIWLASPALPVGGFSYSEGLEGAVENARLSSESDVAEWLLDQLHITQARSDMAVVAQAMRAWRRNDMEHVRALNDWVLQTRETSELRLQTEQMGRSLAQWLHNQRQDDAGRIPAVQRLIALPPTYPVAYALAAADTLAPVRDALLAYAFGWAENMVQAALKAMPLGQSAGQRILARLAAAIPAAAEHANALMDSERQSFSPMLAILSARHETQYSRLFRS